MSSRLILPALLLRRPQQHHQLLRQHQRHLQRRQVSSQRQQAALPSAAAAAWSSCHARLQSTDTTTSENAALEERPPPRPDRLFSSLSLELRAHQPQVLKSYSWFIEESARQLGVSVTHSEGEEEPHKVRKTLLKDVFVHKKCRVQYEIQTYFWLLRASRLTESTRDTFLEYVQRNLPEGVAMKVTCDERLRLPTGVAEDIARRRRERRKEGAREEG